MSVYVLVINWCVDQIFGEDPRYNSSGFSFASESDSRAIEICKKEVGKIAYCHKAPYMSFEVRRCAPFPKVPDGPREEDATIYDSTDGGCDCCTEKRVAESAKQHMDSYCT